MKAIDFTKIRVDLKDIFCTISAISASIVLLLMISIALYKPILVNRVSLRLQAGVSLADLALAIANIRYMHISPGFWCLNNAFFRLGSQILYCGLNICIAINLQMVFLHNIIPRKRWEVVYWVASISLALAFVIPMNALNYFGFDGRGCFLSKLIPKNDTLKQLSTLYIVMATMIYCTIIAVLVMVKMYYQIDGIDNIKDTDATGVMDRRSYLQIFIKKLILRVSLYPICFFICYLGQAVSCVGYIFDYQDENLYNWSVLGMALGGAANLIAFSLDPTFHLALIEIHKDFLIWRKPSNKNKNLETEVKDGISVPKPVAKLFTDSEKILISNERLIAETTYL